MSSIKNFIDETLRILHLPSWNGLSMGLAIGFGFLGFMFLMAFQIPIAVLMVGAALVCLRAHFLEQDQ